MILVQLAVIHDDVDRRVMSPDFQVSGKDDLAANFNIFFILRSPKVFDRRSKFFIGYFS